jgi:hypothetical protein
MQMGQYREIQEEDVEVKLIPIEDCYIVQISSGILRGTLIIDKSMEKEDLVEFSETLYELMNQYSLYNASEDEVPN